MCYLDIGKRFRIGVDWRAWHAGFDHKRETRLRWQIDKGCFQQVLEDRLVLSTQNRRCKTRIFDQFGALDGFTCSPVKIVVACGHNEIPVGAAKCLIWRIAGMRGAKLFRIYARPEIFADLKRGDAESCP